ncbi:MAG: hypothetical protein JKX91_06370 [Rhizobiaceae bacterium]|nr:hypothetical protein [Rhizobiaceae bacterium]
MNYQGLRDYDLKKLQGKEVYLVPTGNNTSYYKRGLRAVIHKVSRVNIRITIGERVSDEILRFEGRILDHGCNSGFIVFETKKEILDADEVRRIGSIIHDKYPYSDSYSQIPIERMREVANILGVNIFNEGGK